ncbi:hydroxymethylglutaryl-CoA lyase [Segetibacter sp. 3557_3]|uniref:hydroxymethylglutaryl-CoA lyase n=1 Tax=Segetibacter sp. 3557_3 TaxID=2547429 RepID=UPI001059062E|nr:hydroxymethylglutaryl-CoA lyase [Segetibacter sp. 3557_3]TDH28863.1 hydroxymethylglutaryl-CoA lyase [Segetibacter sp. 3557_3]
MNTALSSPEITLVECPRDAMQGWPRLISTEQKVAYIDALLKVGFDVLDCGSFVSAKAIPQMADTREVLSRLTMGDSKTKLLVIVANLRGAEDAVQVNEVSYLGFPLSVSETFQQLNTKSSIRQSLAMLESMKELCDRNAKELVVYMSMGFGNPYGDAYSSHILLEWIKEVVSLGIQTISLADTVGIADPSLVKTVVQDVLGTWPNKHFGVHLHSTPDGIEDKLAAALEAGCTRFDGALMGIGGCPMSNNPLVGNMNTEVMISYLQQRKLKPNLDMSAFKACLTLAKDIFK